MAWRRTVCGRRRTRIGGAKIKKNIDGKISGGGTSGGIPVLEGVQELAGAELRAGLESAIGAVLQRRGGLVGDWRGAADREGRRYAKKYLAAHGWTVT